MRGDLLRIRIRDWPSDRTIAEHYDVDSVKVVRRIAAEWALKHGESDEWVFEVWQPELQKWTELGDHQREFMHEIIAQMITA
jgi:hypothetical protein